MNIEKVLRLAKRESVVAIDVKFTDLFGGLHHITLPANSLAQRLFEVGLGFDGSSIPGFSSRRGSDLQLIPDPETAWIDPYWEEKTLSFIGRVCETGTLVPFSADPRVVAQRAEEFLRSSGVADRSIWGPEFEFYLFSAVHYENTCNRCGYRIDSAEAEWDPIEETYESFRYSIPPKSGYHAAPPKDSYYNLRQRIMLEAQKAGIEVKYHHHECGAPGQSELEVHSGPMTEVGDKAVLLKYICKMCAKADGACATFMPKPLYEEAGSGMHFHQQLFNGAEPVFYDSEGYAALSKTALYYIGGLLEHGPALLGITNPSTNSYKRLVPGYEAPVKAIFGLGNRSAAIRIPKYANDPLEKRMEFRPPDATGNIYLSMAAQLLAGLDGIRKQIDPTERGFGPYDQDIAELSDAERSRIRDLPTSLDQALDALERNHDFLLAGNVFTADLIERWIKLKKENEENAIRRRPHPYEMKLYFDC